MRNQVFNVCAAAVLVTASAGAGTDIVAATAVITSTNGTARTVPSCPESGLGDSTASRYLLPVAGDRRIALEFPSPTRCSAQDSRKWGGQWGIRFSGRGNRRKYSPGDVVEWDVTLAPADGAQFADESRQVVMKWGRGCLVANGRADVTLALDGTARPKVYALRFDGSRRGEVSSTFDGGRLAFVADTARDVADATCLYEIVR